MQACVICCAPNNSSTPQGLLPLNTTTGTTIFIGVVVFCRVAENHKRRKLEKKEARRAEQAAKNERKRQEFEALPPEEQQARRERAQQAVAARNEASTAMLARLQEADETGPRLIIDLDFWDYMTKQERRSIVSQLAFCTSHNKRAPRPCSLHCTRCAAALCKHNALLTRVAAACTWQNKLTDGPTVCCKRLCMWWRCGTASNASMFCSFQGPVAEATHRQYPGCKSWHVKFHEKCIGDAFVDKGQLVYLTADSDIEITTLEPGKGYVIGGIVDRNRHKRLCLDKAERLGLKTARLPLSDHVKVLGSKALTVNQVVELLLQYNSLQDWGKAVAAVLPARKTDASGVQDQARE